ncbi:MAG: hypothetical protein ACK5NT_02555 [Pyrinomonadaceae bacterium]
MKNFLILATLVFSLAILSGIIFQQKISANDRGDLGCDDLMNCSGTASCGTPGVVNGCKITCQGEEIINCLAS